MPVQDTSLEAYELAKPNIPSLEDRLLDYLRGRGEQGATDEEIEVALGTEGTRSARPTRTGLSKSGFVVKSGHRRPTKSDRDAHVWVLREFGPDPDKALPVKVEKITPAMKLQALEDTCFPLVELLARIATTGPLETAEVSVLVTNGTATRCFPLDLTALTKLKGLIAP